LPAEEGRIDALTTSRPSIRVWLALLLVTAFAAAVRLVRIDYGLPHRIEPDAEIALQVEFLRSEQPTSRLASAYATYPPLVALVTAALLPAPPEPRDVERASAAEHRRLASRNYLDARRVSALVSLLAVPAAFCLALRFVSPPYALLAAGLVAGSLLGTTFGRQARPHAPAAALVACALVAHLRLLERGGWRSWIGAGALTGLALGTLQSSAALLPPLLAAHALRPGRRWLDPRGLLALALIAASAFAFYPGLFREIPGDEGTNPWNPRVGLVSLDRGWLTFGNHRIDLMRFGGGGLGVVARTLWWYEPALLVLLAAAVLAWGAAAALERQARVPRPALVLGAYLGPYLAALLSFDDTFERFLLPALAPLACFAAWGAASLARRAGAAAGAVAALIAIVGAAASARLAVLHARPDTLEQTAEWVRANVGPDEPVFLSPTPSYVLKDSSIDLPLLREPELLKGPGGARTASYAPWTQYQRRLPEGSAPEPLYDLRWLVVGAKQSGFGTGMTPLEYLRAHPEACFAASGPGVYVVEDHRARPENASDIALQDALARYATAIARFAPDDTGFPFDFQDRVQEGGDWPHVTWRTLTARAVGPVVEIWRLDAEALAEKR
jgi:4-amino-4-deoxy-L-arabinose transferase-like glycosyltransferase